MTLLISVVTAENVIQASDRRLTLPDGTLYNDEANKVICVSCNDARFAISYTGLAVIAGKRTDLWTVDYLTSIDASNMTVPLISKSLENQLTSCLAPTPKKYRATTFLLAEYRLGMPFTALISNFETYRESFDEVRDRFKTDVWALRGPIKNTKRGLRIQMFGTKTSVEKPVVRQIRNLARKRFFHKKDAPEIAEKLVCFIRAASKTPLVGKYVGRNCMTVIIKARPGEPTITKYHPDTNSPVLYMRHLIVGNEKARMTISNIEIWTKKPPWW